jgi:hypothetical protein
MFCSPGAFTLIGRPLTQKKRRDDSDLVSKPEIVQVHYHERSRRCIEANPDEVAINMKARQIAWLTITAHER